MYIEIFNWFQVIFVIKMIENEIIIIKLNVRECEVTDEWINGE